MRRKESGGTGRMAYECKDTVMQEHKEMKSSISEQIKYH